MTPEDQGDHLEKLSANDLIRILTPSSNCLESTMVSAILRALLCSTGNHELTIYKAFKNSKLPSVSPSISPEDGRHHATQY